MTPQQDLLIKNVLYLSVYSLCIDPVGGSTNIDAGIKKVLQISINDNTARSSFTKHIYVHLDNNNNNNNKDFSTRETQIDQSKTRPNLWSNLPYIAHIWPIYGINNQNNQCSQCIWSSTTSYKALIECIMYFILWAVPIKLGTTTSYTINGLAWLICSVPTLLIWLDSADELCVVSVHYNLHLNYSTPALLALWKRVLHHSIPVAPSRNRFRYLDVVYIW